MKEENISVIKLDMIFIYYDEVLFKRVGDKISNNKVMMCHVKTVWKRGTFPVLQL